MAAPRALSILVVLVAAGCGGAWSGTFPVGASGKISITAWKGKVRIRNGAPGQIAVTARGRAPLALKDAVRFLDGKGGAGIRIDEAAKDADLVLEISAPAGISLSCACAEADVDVGGSWGSLEVKTAGAIVGEIDRADSGELESRSGDVRYATKTGPAGHFAAKSVGGDVTIQLPASWNGQIRCLTHGGKLDVPTHANLRTLWDQDEKRVEGWIGPPPSRRPPPAGVASMTHEEEEGQPPAVWGESATGNVSLRIEG